MDFQKLLNISDDWLKYAIRLNLGHESKDNLVEIRKAALADSRIKDTFQILQTSRNPGNKSCKNPGLPIQNFCF